jgi:hypothetical protein
MATYSNGATRTTDPFNGFRPPYKIAQQITFPDITGRDAPGKTGAAAKPALVSALGIEVSGYRNTATTRLAMWSSTGTGGAYSSLFTLTTADTPPLASASLSRTVFAGTGYWIGFTKTTTAQYTWAVDQGFGYSIYQDTANAGDTDDFTASSLITPAAGSNGSLVFQITYDTLPTAVGTPTASSTGTSVTITWTAPSDNGGKAVTSYRIQRSTDGINFSTIVASTGNTSLSYTNTGLTPGTRYYYRVAAINAVAIAHGTDYSGPYSASVDITPAFPASAGNAPSLLTVTVTNPEPAPILFGDFGTGIKFSNIEVSYGSEYLYNQIEATTQDSFATTQVVSAPNSKTQYGVRGYRISDLLNSTDLGAYEVASDYLTYYYEPRLRVEAITVELTNLSLSEQLLVLGIELDTYISVSFTPNGVGDPKIASGLVTGISHRITLSSHQVEFRLRNERNVFILDSDSKGILDQNILGP